MSLTVAVIGASGVVGDVFLRVAEQRKLPIDDLRLLATARSAGMQLEFAGKQITVQETTLAGIEGADIVFCSATSDRLWV